MLTLVHLYLEGLLVCGRIPLERKNKSKQSSCSYVLLQGEEISL